MLMTLCLVRALSWQWLDHHTLENLTPRGEHLLRAVCLAVPLFPAGALLWAAISRRLRTRLAVTLVVMVLLGTVAATATRFSWAKLFDGHYTVSVPSPDGTREAHLFVDGLLGCRGTIYVSDRGALWGTEAATRDASCTDIGVRWVDDQTVEVSGSPPDPLPFNFGPH